MGNIQCSDRDKEKGVVLYDDESPAVVKAPAPTAAPAAAPVAPAPEAAPALAPPAPTAKSAPPPPPEEKSEFSKYGFMLTLSCVAYLLLAGSSTFVPAVIMADVGKSLDMSISSLGALSSAGAGTKAVLIMFLMGPAIEKFGPHNLINVCLVGSGLCNILLATATNSKLYTVYFMGNYVFNSFSEQPAFIVLYATYFQKMLAISTTCIACAFSLGGFGAPPPPAARSTGRE